MKSYKEINTKFFNLHFSVQEKTGNINLKDCSIAHMKMITKTGLCILL